MQLAVVNCQKIIDWSLMAGKYNLVKYHSTGCNFMLPISSISKSYQNWFTNGIKTCKYSIIDESVLYNLIDLQMFILR